MATEKYDNVEELDEEQEELADQNTEDSGDDKGSKEDKGTKGGSSSKGIKTFTQEQVNRMMTKEKKQGRNAAFNELGIDQKDTKAIEQFKAYAASLKTDKQKREEEDAEAKQKLVDAQNRATVAEAKAEAMTLGIKPQFVEDAVTLVFSKLTEDTDLKTLVGELKTKYPVWFGITEEDDEDGKDTSKQKTGQRGTGSSVKKEQGNKDGKKGLGARLAAQRNSINNKKSSYWGGNND